MHEVEKRKPSPWAQLKIFHPSKLGFLPSDEHARAVVDKAAAKRAARNIADQNRKALGWGF